MGIFNSELLVYRRVMKMTYHYFRRFFEVFWGQTQETGSKTRDICCKWGDDMATGQLEEKLQVSQENHLSLMKKSHGGRSKPP